MELLLDIFWERRRVYIEWKQIICAALLAFMTAGLYNFIDIQPDHMKEHMKEQTAPASHSVILGSLVTLPELPGTEEDNKDKSYPRITTGEPNFAVSYGGTADKDDRGRAENVISAKKMDKEAGRGKTAAIENAEEVKKDGSDVAGQVDKGLKHVTEAVPDIPFTDIAAKDPDVLTGGKENDGSIEVGKNDADKTDTDKENTNNADTDKTDTNPDILVERFPGFLINEKGHITGYTDASKFMKDSLAIFPRNAGCTGIEKGALKGLEAEIFEIYLPANIIYIEDGALDDLVNLYFIEAAPGNSRFYSENGILYYRNGEAAVIPNRLRK